MFNTLDTIQGWLVLLGQPPLTDAEITYISDNFPESFETKCDIFPVLVALLIFRISKNDCITFPLKKLELLAKIEGCTLPDIPDVITDNQSGYLIGLGGDYRPKDRC